MSKRKLATSSAPKKGGFRLYNTATRLTKYNVELPDPDRLDPNEVVEFASNSTDSSGKVIYDRDIIMIKDATLPFKAVVKVNSPHGAAMFRKINGHLFNQLSSIPKKYIQLIGHS